MVVLLKSRYVMVVSLSDEVVTAVGFPHLQFVSVIVR